jgi:hypothetical protein
MKDFIIAAGAAVALSLSSVQIQASPKFEYCVELARASVAVVEARSAGLPYDKIREIIHRNSPEDEAFHAFFEEIYSLPPIDPEIAAAIKPTLIQKFTDSCLSR